MLRGPPHFLNLRGKFYLSFFLVDLRLQPPPRHLPEQEGPAREDVLQSEAGAEAAGGGGD